MLSAERTGLGYQVFPLRLGCRCEGKQHYSLGEGPKYAHLEEQCWNRRRPFPQYLSAQDVA